MAKKSDNVEGTSIDSITPAEVVVVEKNLNYWEYCNIVGASEAVYFVAKMKFKDLGTKTTSEWENLFSENKVV